MERLGEEQEKQKNKKSRAGEGEGLCCTKKDGDAENREESKRAGRHEFNHTPNNKICS